MANRVKESARQKQFVIDWSVVPTHQTSEEQKTSEPLVEAETTTGSMPEKPPFHAVGLTMPKLSSGAAAIIHAHLPTPEVERWVEPAPVVAREPNTKSAAGSGHQLGRTKSSETPAMATYDLADSRCCRSVSGLVQVLPWDFRSSFPEPLEEAITTGKLHEEDAEPENVKSLHDEHARHALVILSDLDAVLDARRRGVDPSTDKAPRTEKQRERLEVLFREEPGRLEHAFSVLMDVYEEAFGGEATDAFRKAIRAWHAGIEVISEHPPCSLPLPQSVRGGVFGVEDAGTPVHLSVEEIETITDGVAEKLLGSADAETQDRVLRQYAEDFGQAAADRLAEWTDAKVRAEEAVEFNYDPGHPWHYYYKGDNANPIPLDEIPASDEHGFTEATKLPKDPKRRDAKLRQTLFDQERQLKENERRYTDLIENGVDALNDYDRKIAHGGDDGLAWASAIALSYNHVQHGRGRVQRLRQKLA
jgi:hypothetical protein